jgi:hypothetical protein
MLFQGHCRQGQKGKNKNTLWGKLEEKSGEGKMRNTGRILILSVISLVLSGYLAYADTFSDLKNSFKTSFPRSTEAFNRINGFVQNNLPNIKLSTISNSLPTLAKIALPGSGTIGAAASLSPSIVKYGTQFGRGLYTSVNDSVKSLSTIDLSSYTPSLTTLAKIALPGSGAIGAAASLSPGVVKYGTQIGQNLSTSINDSFKSLSNINLRSYASNLTTFAKFTLPTNQSLSTSINDSFKSLRNINLSNYAPSLASLAKFASPIGMGFKGTISPLAVSLKYGISTGQNLSNYLNLNGNQSSKFARLTEMH